MGRSTRTLFIADLHLDSSRPETIELALRLFHREARQFDAIYILGDFFEYWIGDDAVQSDQQRVFTALESLSGAGTDVHFMAGNRDFLLSKDYLARFGINLLSDDQVQIELGSTPALIMHGDTLCSDDIAYQEFRKQVRAPEWQAEFLAQSIAERQQTVTALRERSKSETGRKQQEIMDVSHASVVEVFRQHDVTQIIHGHTHRPDVHEYRIDGRSCRRYVLGDWNQTARVLVSNGEKLSLLEWPTHPLLDHVSGA